MRTLIAAIGLFVSFAATGDESCRAIDGDTLLCGARERVRVRGLYAPERGDGLTAELAREKLGAAIRSGEVTLIRRSYDKYGRTIADLYVNGQRVKQRTIGLKRGKGSRYEKATRHNTPNRASNGTNKPTIVTPGAPSNSKPTY